MSPDARTGKSTIESAGSQAWGVATGLIAGLALFLATAALVLKGGPDVGAHLGLLSQIFPGYDVTWGGAAVGFVYAFVLGYASGRLLRPRSALRLEQEADRDVHVRIRVHAWAAATAALFAAALAIPTLALVAKGGDHVGPHLARLSLYLPGFQVSLAGALIGSAWLALLGWACGWSIGALYNATVRRAESPR